VRGDFGVDGDGVAVRGDLWRAAQVTLRLLVVAQLCAVVLGAIVGVVGAVRQYSAFDYAATGMAFFLFSIPSPWWRDSSSSSASSGSTAGPATR
jgi:glutathione transport system permease protein